VQAISAVAWLAFVTGGNTNRAVSSTGFATLPLVAAPQLARFDAQGQSSPSSVWAPPAAHSIEVLKPEQALAAGPEGAFPIEAVVSRMNATLSGCGTPPAASATALAESCTDEIPKILPKYSGTVACCCTKMPFADVAGV
jgi:hypothetical protein